MRPITTERDGGGGGSTVGLRTLGTLERERKRDTEAGLDGGHA
jgi:hypothetical protein